LKKKTGEISHACLLSCLGLFHICAYNFPVNVWIVLLLICDHQLPLTGRANSCVFADSKVAWVESTVAEHFMPTTLERHAIGVAHAKVADNDLSITPALFRGRTRLRRFQRTKYQDQNSKNSSHFLSPFGFES
jgi:hypothetical protein